MLDHLTRDHNSVAVALVQTQAGTWRGSSKSGRERGATPKRFGIASTTKAFVATIVLQLTADGRLSLDDTVERWLPGLIPAGRTITIRELLNHTSGLAGDVSFGSPPQERVRQVGQQGLSARPGTTFAYSNTNYAALGLVVEKVTGRGLNQVVRDRIIRPLHLDSTSYGTAGPGSGDRVPWLGDPEPSTGPVSGDGGIVSTTDDLATFARALFAGNLVSQEMLSEMTRTVGAEPGRRAGLGVFRFDLSCGFAWGHGGTEPAYSTMVLAARDGSKVVVVAETGFEFSDVLAAAEEMYCV